MRLKKHVYLMGMRGSGKSTVGMLLSQRLNVEWIDTDVWVEQQAGLSIKEIFEQSGEAGFRDRETQALEWVKTIAPSVVSLGGGIILREKNRCILMETGWRIWLTASPDFLLARIKADLTTVDRRPALSQLSDSDEIKQLLEVRTPIYRDLADFIVTTDHQTPDKVAMQIFEWLAANSAVAG